MTALTAVLIAIFSAGGAATLNALWKGFNAWRAGAARTEARAIQNLEKYRDDADWRATVAEHREAYKSDLADYWRARAGNAEHALRIELGEAAIPPHGALPVYVPIERPTKSDRTALAKVADGDD